MAIDFGISVPENVWAATPFMLHQPKKAGIQSTGVGTNMLTAGKVQKLVATLVLHGRVES